VLAAPDVDCSSVHVAAQRSHLGCLQLQLQQQSSGAPAVLLDNKQRTALHAMQHFTGGCADITAALIESLTQQQQQLTAVINLRGRTGRTALRLTAKRVKRSRKHVCHRCMQQLLAAGAEIYSDEWKPDILEVVIEAAADCDDSSSAAELTVQALVQRGFDINAKDSSEYTQLHLHAMQLNVLDPQPEVATAAASAAAAMIRALLACGGNALARDCDGDAPLHVMIERYSALEHHCREDVLLTCCIEAPV
jgi:hypothetical protein